jgi:hypothetical protein
VREAPLVVAGSGRLSGPTGSAVEQPQPELRAVQLPTGPTGLPAGPGDPEDVVGEPLALSLRQPLLEMGSGEVLVQEV